MAMDKDKLTFQEPEQQDTQKQRENRGSENRGQTAFEESGRQEHDVVNRQESEMEPKASTREADAGVDEEGGLDAEL